MPFGLNTGLATIINNSIIIDTLHKLFLRQKNAPIGADVFGADGEIRTHVPIPRQTHFECVPVRPLRYICIIFWRD